MVRVSKINAKSKFDSKILLVENRLRININESLTVQPIRFVHIYSLAPYKISTSLSWNGECFNAVKISFVRCK